MGTANSGARAKPHSLRLLTGRAQGKDSAGRPVADPPAFVRTAPEPPTGLSREAKAEWRRVVPELDRLKMLKRPSRSSLTAYTETWSLLLAATRDVTRRGVTRPRITTRKDGSVVEEDVANPAVSIMLRAQAAMRSWCVEFGLTPSAESRLSLSEASNAEGDFD